MRHALRMSLFRTPHWIHVTTWSVKPAPFCQVMLNSAQRAQQCGASHLTRWRLNPVMCSVCFFDFTLRSLAVLCCPSLSRCPHRPPFPPPPCVSVQAPTRPGPAASPAPTVQARWLTCTLPATRTRPWATTSALPALSPAPASAPASR